MTTTFVILGVTIILFVWGRWPPDLVALLSLLALALSGVIDTGEALSGFGNPTVVMIAALFVVGEGLALDIVDAFLNAQFEGGRHATRVDMIEAGEG